MDPTFFRSATGTDAQKLQVGLRPFLGGRTVSGVCVHQNFLRPQTMLQNKTDGRRSVKRTFALSLATDV